jgi:hypothetical protein
MVGVGRVFTPLDWACWLIEASGTFEIWRKGGTILDPTCGDGSFLEAFIVLGKKNGYLDAASISRIHGNEIIDSDKDVFIERIYNRYTLKFPEKNIGNIDYFTQKLNGKFDCVVGNPPWSNFTDLPDSQKESVKIAFSRYNLIPNKKDVLLGGSRADVASLVVQKAIADNLITGGIAAFWLPKSIFFNESANKNFRAFSVGLDHFRCEQIYLFDNVKKVVFQDISTSYCAAVFKAGERQSYPVVAHQYVSKSEWVESSVSPPTSDNLGGWKERSDVGKVQNTHKLRLHVSQKPRQGINTCGANDIFIFERAEDVSLHERRLTNSFGETVILPKALTFPLVTRHTLRGQAAPEKWILVPYDSATGRPLSHHQLQKYESARDYLEKHREKLIARKGVLIGSQISKGYFWSMMGVGPYSFAPWKVIWESYGKKEFKPFKLKGEWQGNQAMHAFIPCESVIEADRVMTSLGKMDVESELLRHGMEGTTNWAQPGRMARMFEFSGGLL